MVDVDVRKKCNILFRQWAVAYKSTPGLERIARLARDLPNPKRAAPRPSKVLRETEADAHDHPEPVSSSSGGHSRSSSAVSASASTAPSRPITLSSTPHFSSASKLSKHSKKDKTAKFSLEKEKPNIMQTIASSSVASNNLLNALQLINRETTRVSENAEVANRFETCKTLRRQILRYIQLVESEDLIGSLLSANDELVKALTAYEIMDKSVSDDSDSDAWEHAETAPTVGGASAQLAGLKMEDETPPAKPPRPGSLAMPPVPPVQSFDDLEDASEEDEDEDDPFGDRNAVKTPAIERPGMTWKEV